MQCMAKASDARSSATSSRAESSKRPLEATARSCNMAARRCGQRRQAYQPHRISAADLSSGQPRAPTNHGARAYTCPLPPRPHPPSQPQGSRPARGLPHLRRPSSRPGVGASYTATSTAAGWVSEFAASLGTKGRRWAASRSTSRSEPFFKIFPELRRLRSLSPYCIKHIALTTIICTHGLQATIVVFGLFSGLSKFSQLSYKTSATGTSSHREGEDARRKGTPVGMRVAETG